MKGKLIKRKDRWDLYYDKDISMINTIASSENNPKGKLCLKNCESIERGYNLDELVEEYTENILRPYNSEIESQKSRILFYGAGIESFKEGFKKALSILGDKNFSRQDVIHALTYGVRESKMGKTHSQILEEYKSIQLLEQTEFDVEIEMTWIPLMTYCNSCNKACHKDDLCENKENCGNWKPKLDKNNCFILKRI